jgi:hypothetical protein
MGDKEMTIVMKKIFGFPFMNAGLGNRADARAEAKADARAAVARSSAKMPIEQIKLRMEQALHDVTGIDIERLHYKIRSTRTVDGLWLLRTDMYQTISKLHSQAEAAARINQLLPCFGQWIATRQMSNI